MSDTVATEGTKFVSADTEGTVSDTVATTGTKDTVSVIVATSGK